jgi:hypothetical protein
MPVDDLLLMLLTDEIARRDNTAADNRAVEAGHLAKTAGPAPAELSGQRATEDVTFEEVQRFGAFVISPSIVAQ